MILTRNERATSRDRVVRRRRTGLAAATRRRRRNHVGTSFTSMVRPCASARAATVSELLLHGAQREVLRRLDEQTKRRRASSPARKVEEITGYGRRVTLEQDLEASGTELLHHHWFEGVRETE